jgi:hypoxia-inducible factor 1-alpha inhibitor (HIF hydroxylase)
MSFGDFVAQMHGCSDDPRMLYFQQALVVGVGEQILQDYQQLDLETAVVLKQLGNWKELTTNLLLVAPRGAVTPAHYDEQENVFAQIHGRKHIRLFPPEEFARMFPFPLDHPGDRQSQLEIPAAQEGGLRLPPTNGDRFPNFPRREYACTLEEGEVLYMPAYWWHQIESLTDNVSMTWWFKCADQQVGGEDGRVRLGERSKAALRRNVERLLGQLVAAEATGHAAHAFFRALETQEGISPEDFSPDAAVVTRPDLPEQWPTAISTVSKMLQLVLDSDEIVPFVRELVARRFAHLDVDA